VDDAPVVAVLGSGAVGALLAGLLWQAQVDVTMVTREASAARLARDGLDIESPRYGDRHLHVPVATGLERPVDALVVAVKAAQLEAALGRVAAPADVVVPLLNGIEHVDLLRGRFGDAVVVGSVRVQAHRAGPTRVVHRSPMLTVTLADPGAPGLAAALRHADVDVAAGGEPGVVLWNKLGRLAALALATTAADAPLGAVRAEAETVAAEVVAVARAEGAAVDVDRVLEELRELPDTATSSLRADVVAGSPDHELDAIAGAVLRAGARHGLDLPETARLTTRARARASASLR
jgi:2-dehydropantoate 2-reductase